MEAETQAYLYITLSQTGSLLSRLLKAITGAQYNHVSVSFSPEPLRMYSFGRLHPYNPFWGGFVVESPRSGTYKRFPNTRAVVISVPITEQARARMLGRVRAMLREQRSYRYDLLGLAFAGLHIRLRRRRCYYCSEFVRELLLFSRVAGAEQLAPFVRPIDFLSMPGLRVVYWGRLSEYRLPAAGGAEPGALSLSALDSAAAGMIY